MFLRCTTVTGMHIVEDRDGTVLGTVSGVLCDADRGKVVGFFLLPFSFFSSGQLFVAVQDILRIGTAIHVRDEHRAADPQDIVRIAPFLHDVRTIIGQPIRTVDHGRLIGRCCDFAFDADSFKILRLYPRRWFLSLSPIPAADIIEIREEAIIVREEDATVPETADELQKEPPLPTPELTAPSAGMTTQRVSKDQEFVK